MGNTMMLIIQRPQDVPTGEGVRDGVGCAHHKKVQPGSDLIRQQNLSKKLSIKKFKKGTQFNSFKEILIRTSAQPAILSPT